MFALERTLLAMHIFNMDFQLCAGGKGRWTLIAVVIFDFEVALQMLLDVLLLECAQTADVALEALLLQMNPLIMTTQV